MINVNKKRGVLILGILISFILISQLVISVNSLTDNESNSEKSLENKYDEVPNRGFISIIVNFVMNLFGNNKDASVDNNSQNSDLNGNENSDNNIRDTKNVKIENRINDVKYENQVNNNGMEFYGVVIESSECYDVYCIELEDANKGRISLVHDGFIELLDLEVGDEIQGVCQKEENGLCRIETNDNLYVSKNSEEIIIEI